MRDLCIFARQNVTRDPPFSRLDLISCRNVLIYLGSALQAKVIRMFHYGLRHSGFLVLGIVEGGLKGMVRLCRGLGGDHLLLARYSPPGVVVTRDLRVLQFRGQTSPVRSDSLPVPDGDHVRSVRVAVTPVQPGGQTERQFLVVFEEVGAPQPERPAGAKSKAGKVAAPERFQQLERELIATKQYLQTVIEEQEAAGEELKSANEEIQSSNEELQSTNEELITSAADAGGAMPGRTRLHRGGPSG